MPRPSRRLIAVLALVLAGTARGDEPRSPSTPGLGESQVSVTIVRGNGRRQFRASVLAKEDDRLTLLTAAHCLASDDVDGPAILRMGNEAVEGKVLAIARNPAYQPNQAGVAPGADNALAVLRVDPGNVPAAAALRALRPVPELTARPVPAPTGQTVEVHAIDQEGHEHALRAGNYSNHRWLEWGPAYRPNHGDSGGGVFLLRRGRDGRPRPVLIGVIVDRSDRGGGASLVSLEQRWIADALAR